MNDGDLRMLGARDGLLHALVAIDMVIGRIDSPYRQIDPRHVRLRAQRDEVLRPLREIRDRLKKEHDDTLAAYEKTRTPKTANTTTPGDQQC